MPRANPGPSRQSAVRWPTGVYEAVEALARREERSVSQMYVILVRLGLLARARQDEAAGAPIGRPLRR